MLVGVVCIAAVAALGAAGFVLLRPSRSTESSPQPLRPAQPAQATRVADVAPPPPAPAVQPAARRPKSADDFKVDEIKLDKTQGSSLVYAVGTLTNDSEYQRFGVRIRLDLLNGDGGSVGSAQDYKEILEPHKTWQFRALVIGSKPVSARLGSVTEEP